MMLEQWLNRCWGVQSSHQAPVNQRCSATLPTCGQPASGPSILTFAREHAEPDANVGIGPLANDTSGRWTIGNAGRNDCQSSRHEGCVADPKMAFPILRRQRRRPPHQAPKTAPTVSACELVGAMAIVRTDAAANKHLRMIVPR